MVEGTEIGDRRRIVRPVDRDGRLQNAAIEYIGDPDLAGFGDEDDAVGARHTDVAEPVQCIARGVRPFRVQLAPHRRAGRALRNAGRASLRARCRAEVLRGRGRAYPLCRRSSSRCRRYGFHLPRPNHPWRAGRDSRAPAARL